MKITIKLKYINASIIDGIATITERLRKDHPDLLVQVEVVARG